MKLAELRQSARVAGAILLGVCTAALVTEGLLRLTDRYDYSALAYDPVTGLIRYQPETDYHSVGSCYDVVAHINNVGLYGPDVAPEKAPGVYRVIVLGNSFTEAIQVPLSERFDTIATNELNAGRATQKYEVVALGFPANGTYLTMLYYQEYLAALHPDLVIDIMTDSTLGKDAPDTVNPPRFDAQGKAILELPAAKRNSLVISLKEAGRSSKLFEALYQKYLLVRGKIISGNVTGTPTTSESDLVASWDTESKLFASFKPLVEKSGAKFAVASWTTDDTDDRTFMRTNLSPIARANGIPFIDLTAPIDAKSAATGASAMLPCNGHWGTEGNAWVGDILAAYIRAHTP